MSGRPGCSPFARAAALALSAIFVLPSCFTLGVWRATRISIGEPFAISTAPAPPAGAPRFLSRWGTVPAGAPAREVSERALARVCAQWQPALTPGTWLAVEPIEHADDVARLWREMPQQCVLYVVAGKNGAAPRCWFACHPMPQSSGPGRPAAAGLMPLQFEAECRVTPTAAPEGVPTTSIKLQPCIPPSLAARLLATPLALALDRTLLMMELVFLPLWW